MKSIKQAINAFEKQLINTKQQIRQHNQSLVDYAQALKEYAQYLYNTRIIEHEIKAVFLARKAIRCYGWVYQTNPQKYQALYAEVLVVWFDCMNLYQDYEEGIRLAENALIFYQPLLQKHKKQYLPAYAKLLADYGYCLYKNEQITKAQAVLIDSLAIYKSLVKHDASQLLAYCQAQHNYALSWQESDEQQAQEVMASCLELLKQATDQQSLVFKAARVKHLEFYIELLADDLPALGFSEQLLVMYRELIKLDFKNYAGRYARFLVRYADCSEDNVWTDGYDGYYGDSPRLLLADQLMAEAVEVHKQLIASGALYEDWGYIRTLKRYTEFLLGEEQPDRAVVFAKQTMDFAKKVFNKENTSTLIVIRCMDELNYARVCQLYARALGDQGRYSEVAKVALQGIFWYEQITLLDPYYLEELCSGLYQPEDYTNALQSTGIYLDNIDKTQQALIYFEKAYQLARRRYNKSQAYQDLRPYLSAFNDYINLLNDNGHTEQALTYSNELLEMAVKNYGIKKDRGVYQPILVKAYGNHAYILAHNQRDEEALIQTKKALACNGLVWYGYYFGYDENKAWLLGNLACYQNNLGDAERALKNAQKALSIRLQYFKENPLLWFMEVQSSHRRCANILKGLGRIDEALTPSKQVLDLDKEYQFTSSWLDRFAVKLLNWLNGKKVRPLAVINAADEDLEPRDKQELNFEQYWLLTCLMPSHDYLTRALYYLVHMDQDLQSNYLEELVVLMSLLKQRGWALPESLIITQDWLISSILNNAKVLCQGGCYWQRIGWLLACP